MKTCKDCKFFEEGELCLAEIKSCLDKLSYREREIIKLRYGIGDGYTYTLEEVSRIFKVSRERVRQVEQRAIKKIKYVLLEKKNGT